MRGGGRGLEVREKVLYAKLALALIYLKTSVHSLEHRLGRPILVSSLSTTAITTLVTLRDILTNATTQIAVYQISPNLPGASTTSKERIGLSDIPPDMPKLYSTLRTRSYGAGSPSLRH